jgi:hypothetical protein
MYRSYFLDLGTSWERSASRPGRITPKQRGPGIHWKRRLGGPQSQCGRRGVNSWPYQDSNSNPGVVHPVATRLLTALSGLRFWTGLVLLCRLEDYILKDAIAWKVYLASHESFVNPANSFHGYAQPNSPFVGTPAIYKLRIPTSGWISIRWFITKRSETSPHSISPNFVSWNQVQHDFSLTWGAIFHL